VQGSSQLPAELREWAQNLYSPEEIAACLADLKELREKGGLELQEFLAELEQVVHGREPTER
jgi:hypothetical protein